jgi:predicted AAA+ superfamily ATPase
MYSRLLSPPSKSFFLFGPRGTGKSTWLGQRFPQALVIDLLNGATLVELLADPSRLEAKIPSGFTGVVVLDEVQKAPELLNEVHRLIEKRHFRFALTGSSARSLKKKGVNLLAGRAVTLAMHPLTCAELGSDFDLRHSLQYGQLPAVYVDDRPEHFLKSYVATYLKEEVQQEGLTRNLGAFARFLETISFSQAGLLNIAEVARDAAVERKVVESYVIILDDLLLARRLRPFTRRARRESVAHPKFFLFDAGVFRAVRPQGPLDSDADIDGQALETLVYQELRATIDALQLSLEISFWRTKAGDEVDFVLYGKDGFFAFEVKRSNRLRGADFDGLNAFGEEYPESKRFLLHGGSASRAEHDVHVVPVAEALARLPELLGRRAQSTAIEPR